MIYYFYASKNSFSHVQQLTVGIIIVARKVLYYAYHICFKILLLYFLWTVYNLCYFYVNISF